VYVIDNRACIQDSILASYRIIATNGGAWFNDPRTKPHQKAQRRVQQTMPYVYMCMYVCIASGLFSSRFGQKFGFSNLTNLKSVEVWSSVKV
jgi:hypothetical protein